MDNKQKKNWFARIMIIILCVLIATLIILSFVFSEQKFVITSGIIIGLVLLIVLALSEVFDSFSVGNLITIKKRLKETADDLTKAKQENEILRNQIINNMSILTKQNNSQNFIISPDVDLKKMIGIEKASEEKNKEEKDKEVVEFKKVEREDYSKNNRLFYYGFEKYALEKIKQDYDIDNTQFFENIQFKEGMMGYDPIMDRNVHFDGYFTNKDCEYFVEIKSQISAYSVVSYMIYYMLNKIYFYNQATKKNAKLLLVVPLIKEDLQVRFKNEEELVKLKEVFMPAINNGLLEIKPINVNQETYEEIIKKEDKFLNSYK